MLTKTNTNTAWRNDDANLDVVRQLNRAYARIPFSQEYEGVLDECPMQLHWSVGPNLPFPWKGGIAGLIDDEVLLAGGLWMPDRCNKAYSYNLATSVYSEVPPPPFDTELTQGACDGESLFLIGGCAAGRSVARLCRSASGKWKWRLIPDLPKEPNNGRLVATAAIIPGQWLFLVSGYPVGTTFDKRDAESLPNWRLRLDEPNAQWERMAPYPGEARGLMPGAVTNGALFVFGGAIPDAALREIYSDLIVHHELTIGPYKGCHDYRDSYRYDPSNDDWKPIRSLPFPMAGGNAVAIRNRYVLLLGSQHVNLPTRVGTSQRLQSLTRETAGRRADSAQEIVPFWTGYDDRILCYDTLLDNYSRVGAMLYGVTISSWIAGGMKVYGFGGEPFHSHNNNTENVLQIGTLEFLGGKGVPAPEFYRRKIATSKSIG